MKYEIEYCVGGLCYETVVSENVLCAMLRNENYKVKNIKEES